MPRRPRIKLAGMPQHIVQRGINREPCSAANWMKKPWATFGLPCLRASRWVLAVSLKRYVRRLGSGAHKSDLDDPQASQINPAIQKRRPDSDSEQARAGQMIEGINNAKLTPLVLARCMANKSACTRKVVMHGNCGMGRKWSLTPFICRLATSA
jgi:hypothetical protein